MARRSLFLLAWAVGGIGLAVAFFLAWFKSGGFGLWSTVALFGCILWNALLGRLTRQ